MENTKETDHLEKKSYWEEVFQNTHLKEMVQELCLSGSRESTLAASNGHYNEVSQFVI